MPGDIQVEVVTEPGSRAQTASGGSAIGISALSVPYRATTQKGMEGSRVVGIILVLSSSIARLFSAFGSALFSNKPHTPESTRT